MTIQDKKKKTVGVAIAAVGAAAIALGAGTFASFSSTQNGPDTTLAAGKLDFGQSSTTPIELSGFVPGGPAKTATITFTNSADSSLTGDLSLAFDLQNNVDNGCSGDEEKVDPGCDGGVGDLPGKLMVTVTDGSGGDPLYIGSLSGLDTSTLVKTMNVAKGNGVTYTFSFTLPNTNDAPGVVNPDNAVQGDSVTLKTTATLVQSAK